MNFEKAAVFYNKLRPQNRLLAEEVCAWLAQHDVQARIITALDKLSRTDLLICMGGDGAMLRCARRAAPLNVPVLGINCGTLGFLAACEKENFKEALTDLFQGKFFLQERMMLSVRIQSPIGKIQELMALNECVLRSEQSRALTINARYNNRDLPPVFGDGVLIATPSGSTAYSLAAGGPIIFPELEGFLATPICPHMLTHRPLFLPADGVIELFPQFKTAKDSAYVSVDGQVNLPLPPDVRVQIFRSKAKAKLLMNPKRDFFTCLNRKLNWGSR